MRKVAGNDVLECYAVTSADTLSRDRATILHADRATQDQRMNLMVTLVTSMANMSQLGSTLHAAADGSGVSTVSAAHLLNTTDIIMRASDLVEKIWDEGLRRGWILTLPPYPDAFFEDDE